MQTINDKSEREWLALLQKKDESAFTIIYNHYWEPLYIAAYGRIKNVSVSEEIVQEVFLQLWRKKDVLSIENLSAYLATMTRYNVYRYISDLVKRKEKEEVWTQSHHHWTVSNFDNQFLLEMIDEVSNELPEKCRLVFKYNKLEDRSIKDVADALNISPKTAEAHLTKALQFIRWRMSKIISVAFLIISLL